MKAKWASQERESVKNAIKLGGFLSMQNLKYHPSFLDVILIEEESEGDKDSLSSNWFDFGFAMGCGFALEYMNNHKGART